MSVYYHIYPGRKSRDFINYKKSVKMERPLIRVSNNKNTVVQQNWLKALLYLVHVLLFTIQIRRDNRRCSAKVKVEIVYS